MLVAAAIILSSCVKPIDSDITDETLPQTDAVTTDAATKAENEETTNAPETEEAETEAPLPCLIGLYDELGAPGTYTRLSEWNDPWIQGKDIAVFDIIPSSEESLTDPSFQNLWKTESDKISPDAYVKPYLLLEYTLTDGTKESFTITGWKEAEEIIAKGHIEIYLYDDIHQDGGWYSHLTEADTNEETVISSVKLTAGKNIASVESIVISAYIEGSSPATVTVTNGK